MEIFGYAILGALSFSIAWVIRYTPAIVEELRNRGLEISFVKSIFTMYIPHFVINIVLFPFMFLVTIKTTKEQLVNEFCTKFIEHSSKYK